MLKTVPNNIQKIDSPIGMLVCVELRPREFDYNNLCTTSLSRLVTVIGVHRE